jgi:starvation-inducible DNA-binding protein
MKSTIAIDFKGALPAAPAPDPVIVALSQVLASSYALSALAQNAHWNTEGPTFYQLHSAFGSIYESAADSVDEIAERIRQLGHYVTVDLAAFQSAAGFTQPPAPQPANDWVNALLAAHEKVIADWKAVEKAPGVSLEEQDLATNAIQALVKSAWMLRSTVKA